MGRFRNLKPHRWGMRSFYISERVVENGELMFHVCWVVGVLVCSHSFNTGFGQARWSSGSDFCSSLRCSQVYGSSDVPWCLVLRGSPMSHLVFRAIGSSTVALGGGYTLVFRLFSDLCKLDFSRGLCTWQRAWCMHAIVEEISPYSGKQ